MIKKEDFIALLPLVPNYIRTTDKEAMENLLDNIVAKQNIDATNKALRTLLIYSAYVENEALTQKLLAYGANPLKQDNIKMTALDWSLDNRGESPKCCALLVEAHYRALWRHYEAQHYAIGVQEQIKEFFKNSKNQIDKHSNYQKAQEKLSVALEHFNLWHNATRLEKPVSANNSNRLTNKI